MHEATIVTALLEQLAPLCRQHRPRRPYRVTVAVGARSGIHAGALADAYDALAPGSCAAGATLVIESIATRLECRTCQRSGQPTPPFTACPHCGSTDTQITGGEELLLKSLDFGEGLPPPQPQGASNV
jgi:hydrogenase nickel incorporation protein HypA/HybF